MSSLHPSTPTQSAGRGPPVSRDECVGTQQNIYVCFMALIRRQNGLDCIINTHIKTKTLEELTKKINEIIQSNQSYKKFERILSIKVSKITSNNNYLDVDNMLNWRFDDNTLDEDEILGKWFFGYGAVETSVWQPAKD